MKIQNTIIFCCLMVSLNGITQPENRKIFNGNQLYTNGNYDEAARLYLEALESSPNYPIALFNYANALYQQHQYATAEKYFGLAINNSTDTALLAKAYYNKGVAAVAQQSWKNAIDDFKQSLILRPNNKLATENLCKAILAMRQTTLSSTSANTNQPQSYNEKTISKVEAEDILKQLRLAEMKLEEAQKMKIRHSKASKDW